MALGSTQPLTEMSTRNISRGGKCGRCVWLTTLPPSCADCLEIWEPRPPGSLMACPGLWWDCFTGVLEVRVAQTYAANPAIEEVGPHYEKCRTLTAEDCHPFVLHSHSIDFKLGVVFCTDTEYVSRSCTFSTLRKVVEEVPKICQVCT
jgi:hypothetical protein